MKIGNVSLATTGNKLELEHPNIGGGGGEHIIKQTFKYYFLTMQKKNVKIKIQVLLSLWDIWSSIHTHTVFKQVSATQTI